MQARSRLLECVFLPGWLEEVPASCFRNSSLSRVTFGSGSVLKRIGKEAFSGCKELLEIEIPASVEEIGGGCFTGCNVERLSFSGETELFVVVGPLLIAKEHNRLVCPFKELREIEIPASVEEIGERCFYECSSLSRVTFGRGSVLKRIGKKAFRGCDQLRKIEIPASLEEIGEGCFGDSYRMQLRKEMVVFLRNP